MLERLLLRLQLRLFLHLLLDLHAQIRDLAAISRSAKVMHMESGLKILLNHHNAVDIHHLGSL